MKAGLAQNQHHLSQKHLFDKKFLEKNPWKALGLAILNQIINIPAPLSLQIFLLTKPLIFGDSEI